MDTRTKMLVDYCIQAGKTYPWAAEAGHSIEHYRLRAEKAEARITELEAELAKQAPAVEFAAKMTDSVAAICDLHGRTEGDLRDASRDQCVNAYISAWRGRRERIAELEAENERMAGALKAICSHYASWYVGGLASEAGDTCYRLKCIAARAIPVTGPTAAPIPEGESDSAPRSSTLFRDKTDEHDGAIRKAKDEE